MAALTANRDTLEIDSSFAQLTGDYGGGSPLAAGVFYKGQLIVWDPADQKIKPAVTGANLKCIGRCEEYVALGSTVTGVRVRSGIFGYAMGTAGDALVQSDVGATVYIIDDQTVAKVSTGRSIAGKLYKVDGATAYVTINPLV